jgi:hypothetical protein
MVNVLSDPMTLDQAIEHCKEKAACTTKCGQEHRQLAEWLVELRERRVKEGLVNDAVGNY